MRSTAKEIINIRNLNISFLQYKKHSFDRDYLSVISDLSVSVHEGEIVAVVGSSGSGKSLLADAVFGLLPRNAQAKGNITFEGKEIGLKEIEKLRGRKMSLVPQSVNNLDPLMNVGNQITNGKKDAASINKMRELEREFHLDQAIEKMYPFELSGGMARRVLLMTALMNDPKLIIADEPTPGMELMLSKRAMRHFRDFADKGNGVLLITHDLELAVETADRIAVFYAGKTTEEVPADAFKDEKRLKHPYTKALFRAMPVNGFRSIPGIQPYAGDMPPGCAFGPRCPHFTKECEGEIPVVKTDEGMVRCIYGGF